MQSDTVICWNRQLSPYWNERQVVPTTSVPDVGGAANGCYTGGAISSNDVNQQLGELADHEAYMTRDNFSRWEKCRIPLVEVAYEDGNRLFMPYFPDGAGNQRPIVDLRDCQNYSRMESNLIGFQKNPDLSMKYGVCSSAYGQCGITGCQTPYPTGGDATGSMAYDYSFAL